MLGVEPFFATFSDLPTVEDARGAPEGARRGAQADRAHAGQPLAREFATMRRDHECRRSPSPPCCAGHGDRVRDPPHAHPGRSHAGRLNPRSAAEVQREVFGISAAELLNASSTPGVCRACSPAAQQRSCRQLPRVHDQPRRLRPPPGAAGPIRRWWAIAELGAAAPAPRACCSAWGSPPAARPPAAGRAAGVNAQGRVLARQGDVCGTPAAPAWHCGHGPTRSTADARAARPLPESRLASLHENRRASGALTSRLASLYENPPRRRNLPKPPRPERRKSRSPPGTTAAHAVAASRGSAGGAGISGRCWLWAQSRLASLRER